MRHPDHAIPPLLGLHAFEAAARHGSFAGAAAELYLTPAAISQRVRVLEAHLGNALFERLPRSLRLTEIGQAYLPAVRDTFDQLSASTSGLFSGHHPSRLTIRTPISYATTWLLPRLPQFQHAFPHIQLRLLTAIWSDALPPDDVDLDIRQGNGTWPGYRAAHLHDDAAIIICGRGILPGRQPLADAGTLFEHPRIQVLGFDDLWTQVFATTPSRSAPPERAISVDTTVAALALIEHGEYWGIVPERFARLAIRAGKVFIAVPGTLPMRQKHYLLRPDTAAPTTGHAAAFTQWLRAQDLIDTPISGRQPMDLMPSDS